VLRKILVGLDGSEGALRAARLGAELATRFEARLVLVYVVPPVALPPDAHGAEVGILEGVRRAGEQILAQAREQLSAPGLALETRVEFGGPAETLADLAAAEHADLVVVGSRGRGAVARVLLGSVADRLSHVCGTAVLIVPPAGRGRG
jgi:nucleotide-binding universal stress UspA family protein